MQRAGLSARRCPRDPVASRFVGRARAAAHAETQPLLLPPPATIPERGCADSTPRTRLPIFGAWRRRTAKDTPAQLAARMRSCRPVAAARAGAALGHRGSPRRARRRSRCRPAVST